MTTQVKHFLSSHQNAPVIAEVWGDLITLLDAVLVNGFNQFTITSITLSGTTATVTIAGGHKYSIGQVLIVSGADQAGYNKEFVIGEPITATTFTYQVTGSPVSPATGTVIVKVAPLGFDKPFNGTNKAVYRSPNVASNRPYLRVDHSLDPLYNTAYAKYGRVTMAESMTGIDTFGAGGRAPYNPTTPTINEVAFGSGATVQNGWYKWYTTKAGSQETAAAVAGARAWAIVGDDRGFYFHISNTANTVFNTYGFTDFLSFKTDDAYDTLLMACDWSWPANRSDATIGNNNFAYSNDYWGKALMRDYTQNGVYTSAAFCTYNPTNSQLISGATAAVPYPNGTDFGLVLLPVTLRENAGHLRGQMPGMYFIPQAVYNTYPHATILDSPTGYSGRKFLILSDQTNIRIAYDITGPWSR